MVHDVAIIGAGPIGLELAACLKRMGTTCLHLEAGPVGATIAWYPRQARFFSSPDRIAIAGVPLATPDQSKATREQYLAYLRTIVQQFDLKVRCYERVELLHAEPGVGFALATTRDGRPLATHHARRVVLAIGDMHRPRLLDIPGEELSHVSHYFDEPHRYFGQRLLIVGGKNSAAEAAIRCDRAGARVAISYRGSDFDPDHIKYWLLPELKTLVRGGQIAMHRMTVPVSIQPDSVTLQRVDEDGRPTGDPPTDARVDFVLLLTGYEMDPKLLLAAGAQLEDDANRAPVLDPDTMMTTVPGLYVAGTATAGTQHGFRSFIETSHVHVEKIARDLTGQDPPPDAVNRVELLQTQLRPES